MIMTSVDPRASMGIVYSRGNISIPTPHPGGEGSRLVSENLEPH